MSDLAGFLRQSVSAKYPTRHRAGFSFASHRPGSNTVLSQLGVVDAPVAAAGIGVAAQLLKLTGKKPTG